MFYSIIIPCFNSEKTILRALNSVINQTYKDFEIIIVDDGSNDKTKDIIEVFLKNSTMSYKYIYQKNNGPSSARNNGVKNAIGDYIAFLDSDDEWHKDKLKVQMKLIKEKNLNFLGSTYQYEAFNYDAMQSLKIHKYSFNSLLLKTRFSTPGVVMLRAFFMSLNGFDENLKYAEDNDLWLRASLVNDLYMISEPKLVRLHKKAYGAGGLSADMYQMNKGELYVLKKLYILKKISFFKYHFLRFFITAKFLKRLVQNFL